MTRQIFLHIGLHKTGTTFLQQTLFRLETWLAGQGILYPRTGLADTATSPNPMLQRTGHVNFLSALRNPDKRYGRAMVRALDTLIEQHDPHTLVLSSELFFGPHQNLNMTHLQAVLGQFGQIRPIVYLRRQDAYMESLYLERLGWQNPRLQQAFAPFVRNSAAWMNYPARLAPWRKAIPDSNWIIRSYDDVAQSGGLLTDFLGHIGATAPLPETIHAQDRVRGSINPEFSNLLLAANQLSDVEAEDKRALVHSLRVDPQFATPPGPRPSLFTDELWDEVADKYRPMNAKLAKGLITGPSDRFLFPSKRPAVYQVKQRFLLKAARKEARAHLWALHSQRQQATPQLRARAQIGIAALVTEGAEISRTWLAYHLNQGVNRIALVCVASSPALPSDISEHPHVDVLTLDKADIEAEQLLSDSPFEAQQAAARRKADISLRAIGMDWTLFLGQNELLYGDLHRAAANLPPYAQLMLLRPYEAVQHRNMPATPPFDARWFRISAPGPVAAPSPLGKLQGNYGFLGSIAPCSLVRSDVKIDDYDPYHPKHSCIDHSSVETAQAVILRFENSAFPFWHRAWNRRAANTVELAQLSGPQKAQWAKVAPALKKASSEDLVALHHSWSFCELDWLVKMRDRHHAVLLDIPTSLFDTSSLKIAFQDD